jgi:cytochrome c553
MKKIVLTLLLINSLFASISSYEKGRDLYNAKGCSNCHGTNAEGSGEFPKLANRSKNMLLKKLKNFKQGKATNQRQMLMFGFVKGLSKNEMDAITTYLSEYKEEPNDKYELDYDIIGGDN